MKNKSGMMELLVRGRFSLLLTSFALLFFVGPLLTARYVVLDKMFSILVLVVLMSCLRAITENRRFFFFMLGLSLLILAVGIPEVVLDPSETPLLRASMLWLRLLYLLLVVLSILRYILNGEPVTADKICGALSAYLLLGLLWAAAYGLFAHYQPGSFRVPDDMALASQAADSWTIYFSYATLTTLGYGDITPLTPAARSFAFMEAACGQIFLAVLVARLVALHILHNGKQTEEMEDGLDQA